jgi:hypothetical protein
LTGRGSFIASWRNAAALALVPAVAALALAAVDTAFRASPDAESYTRAGDRLLRLSEDAREALAALIERDEVTWDPTNGSELQTVLAHLKEGRGDRVLLLGSSQLITLRDDRSMGSFTRRVDKILERSAARPVTVYNLSIGGMSAPEKALVLERAAETVRFDDVVLALTLWDSVSDSRRAAIDRLSAVPPRKGEPFGASDGRSGPAAVNRAVAEFVERRLEEHVAFFRDRSAIQSWIAARFGAAFPAAGPTAGGTAAGPPASKSDAAPMQYVYSDEQLARAVVNVRGLLQTAAAVHERDGSRVSVLLTPFRQDSRSPAYDPKTYARFRAAVQEDCGRFRFDLIDASELLGPSHFGPYEFGETRGRIDVLHFDSRGHEVLAAALSRAIGLYVPGGAPSLRASSPKPPRSRPSGEL